jgi:hypothetical protein
MDVAEVDRDVAYVAMIIHVCCTLLFPMFHPFFIYVARVLIWILHMFHAYVVSDLSRCCIYLQWFQVFFGVFASALDAYFKCLISLNICCKCCIWIF